MSGSNAKSGEQGAEFVAFVTDKETQASLQKLVLDLMLPHAMIRIGSVADAIEYLRAAPRSPDQLIIDISHSAMPLSDINSLADTCEPNVNVVVIGDRNDIGLFRDLMRLGVSDYISKPVTPTLLQRTLNFESHHAEPVRQARVGKVVTVVGTRGGVGTSTVAVNLSWLLANRVARRAVVIDKDMHLGDIGMMMNQPTNQGLLEVMQNAHRIDPVLMGSIFIQQGPRLSMLTAEMALQDEAVISPQAMQDLVDVLQHHFHYIIFDVPLAGGPLLWHMLEKSDLNLVVSDTSAISVRNFLRLSKLFNPQHSTQRNMVVLNHVRPENCSVVPRADFETAIGRRVDYVIPFGGAAMATAENLGEAFAHNPPEVAQAMLDIAHDLSGLALAKPKKSWKSLVLGGLGRVRAKATQ